MLFFTQENFLKETLNFLFLINKFDFLYLFEICVGFPHASNGKEFDCKAVDPGLISGSGRTTNHSNILDWRITWTEEPGRAQSMGSQRVRHD